MLRKKEVNKVYAVIFLLITLPLCSYIFFKTQGYIFFRVIAVIFFTYELVFSYPLYKKGKDFEMCGTSVSKKVQSESHYESN